MFALGTLIDGKPIITLPPKVVELKKVDFTEAERNFYTRLEADSRAQFKVWVYSKSNLENELLFSFIFLVIEFSLSFFSVKLVVLTVCV